MESHNETRAHQMGKETIFHSFCSGKFVEWIGLKETGSYLSFLIHIGVNLVLNTVSSLPSHVTFVIAFDHLFFRPGENTFEAFNQFELRN